MEDNEVIDDKVSDYVKISDNSNEIMNNNDDVIENVVAENNMLNNNNSSGDESITGVEVNGEELSLIHISIHREREREREGG